MYDICHIISEYYFGIHSKEYLLNTLLPGGWELGGGGGGGNGEIVLYLPKISTLN